MSTLKIPIFLVEGMVALSQTASERGVTIGLIARKEALESDTLLP